MHADVAASSSQRSGESVDRGRFLYRASVCHAGDGRVIRQKEGRVRCVKSRDESSSIVIGERLGDHSFIDSALSEVFNKVLKRG